MTVRDKIFEAADKLVNSRKTWLPVLEGDKEFLSRGGIIYPYDTISANLSGLFELFDQTGITSRLETSEIVKVADIGCANGELGLSFAQAGFEATAIDYSYKHDQAPYVVSRIGEILQIPITVADINVDTHFTVEDLARAVCSKESHLISGYQFDLAICLGLLYHLKNPFAFLESLGKLSRYALVGTHIITHTPNFRYRVDDYPIAYLVDSLELNNDPTNFWMLSERAFVRLVERCGFKLLGKMLLPNNPLELAVPDRPDIGVRCFLMLESVG